MYFLYNENIIYLGVLKASIIHLLRTKKSRLPNVRAGFFGRQIYSFMTSSFRLGRTEVRILEQWAMSGCSLFRDCLIHLNMNFFLM